MYVLTSDHRRQRTSTFLFSSPQSVFLVVNFVVSRIPASGFAVANCYPRACHVAMLKCLLHSKLWRKHSDPTSPTNLSLFILHVHIYIFFKYIPTTDSRIPHRLPFYLYVPLIQFNSISRPSTRIWTLQCLTEPETWVLAGSVSIHLGLVTWRGELQLYLYDEICTKGREL